MAKKPNLLFIFTDEQRFDTLSCYGNTQINTPNLDKLADRSFVFEHAYVTQSVCTPSRSSIMTGQWPHTNGCTANNIPLRPETRTIAEMVDDEYVKGYYGKWHLGDEVIAQHGFEHWVSIEDMYRQFYSDPRYLDVLSSYHHFLVDKGYEPKGESEGAKVFPRGDAARMPVECTKARFLGHQASQFIRDNKDQPFMLYVNTLEPHMPFFGPYDDMYDPESLDVCENFYKRPPENASGTPQAFADYYADTAPASCDLSTEAGYRKLRAQYFGLVTLVDQAVGDILKALDESGQADNTIIVFTSDHGDMMGNHAMYAKCVQYEEALKVPLLVHVPWLGDKQQRIRGNISQIDLVPTLLDLMGQPTADDLEGESKADVLQGQRTLEDNDVIAEWNSPYLDATQPRDDTVLNKVHKHPRRVLVTSDRWKLNACTGDQSELYDLNSDPCEMTNLYDDPSQKGRIADMLDRIRVWQRETGDDCPLT